MLFRRDEPAQRDGIVNVGHSFSGTAFLLAELEKGRDGGEALGEGLLLLDPMVSSSTFRFSRVGALSLTSPHSLLRSSILDRNMLRRTSRLPKSQAPSLWDPSDAQTFGLRCEFAVAHLSSTSLTFFSPSSSEKFRRQTSSPSISLLPAVRSYPTRLLPSPWFLPDQPLRPFGRTRHSHLSPLG